MILMVLRLLRLYAHALFQHNLSLSLLFEFLFAFYPRLLRFFVSGLASSYLLVGGWLLHSHRRIQAD
jgi:hypothetical protein